MHWGQVEAIWWPTASVLCQGNFATTAEWIWPVFRVIWIRVSLCIALTDAR